MKPDAMLVEPECLADALLELSQHGKAPALRSLRHQEPVLSAFIQEKLAALLGRLALTGAPPPVVRGVYRDALFLVLGSLQALRRGHYALWRDTMPAERLPSPDLAPAPQPPAGDGPVDGQVEVPF